MKIIKIVSIVIVVISIIIGIVWKSYNPNHYQHPRTHRTF